MKTEIQHHEADGWGPEVWTVAVTEGGRAYRKGASWTFYDGRAADRKLAEVKAAK